MVSAIETSIASVVAGTRVVAYPRVAAGGDYSSAMVWDLNNGRDSGSIGHHSLPRVSHSKIYVDFIEFTLNDSIYCRIGRKFVIL